MQPQTTVTPRCWLEPEPVYVPPDLRARVGGHPLLAQTLIRRGHADPDRAAAFLDPDLYAPADPRDLPDMDAAAERIEAAIARGERILIWGDFDVDGQTATATLVTVLTDLGADVGYRVPVRADESHGLNLPVLARFLEQRPGLLITCDTGVTDHEPIAYAVAQGVDVIVTDHHELPDELPAAVAVLNPKRLPEDHPLRELSGVGVTFKLAEDLYRRAGRAGEEARLLDLAALGLVADLALQVGDVRYLIQRGLQALRESGRAGIRALLETAQVEQARLNEGHVSYALAPRLNAVGRLADANVAVDLLLTPDLSRARVLAQELEGLNARRQLLSEQVFQAAEAQIAADPSLLEEAALVLAHPAWPSGVIGIVASRLVDRHGKPTVLIAMPEGELARGSARSVEGCNITEAIAEQAHLLEGFGGHPMAAGLRLKPESIPEFRHGLSRSVLRALGQVREAPAIAIDGFVPLTDLSMELVEDLDRLAPFGPGNPPLRLATAGLTVRSQTTMGRTGEHLQVFVQDAAGNSRRVLYWGGAGATLPAGRFDLAYTARVSEFRGLREVQIEWVDGRPVEQEAARQAEADTEVVDLRPYPDPREVLLALRRSERVQVWAEVDRPDGSVTREGLTRGRPLIIWTAPPGPAELRRALERVSPPRVYLLAQDPGTDDPAAFINRLAGLAKYVLSSWEGRTTLSGLAAAMGQREETVRAGLDWLGAKGDVQVSEEDGAVRLAPGDGKTGDPARAQARLRALLQETRAWREHYRTAKAESLVRGE